MPELRREVLLGAQRRREPLSSICERFGISPRLITGTGAGSCSGGTRG
jgi:hypothetical protein